MAEKDHNGREAELDKFWDIDELIPKKKTAENVKRISFDTETAEISDDSSKTEAPKDEKKLYRSEAISPTEFKRFIPPFTEKDMEIVSKPDLEYTRENSLIKKVRIYNWQSKYKFYERFTEDAKRLWNKKGEIAKNIPFFSFSPQYAQLNREQLAFYLWWRECFRRGEYIDADYSYVLLYVYEIINLSDSLSPEYCLDQMCTVWLNYGERHPFIGKYLSEWVCDLCLINNLVVPAERIRKLYPQIMKDCTLKEFYALCEGGGNLVCAQTLMDVCGAYDYKKSKCATPERLPLMEKYLTGALRKVLKTFAKSEKAFAMIGNADNHTVRSAYTGALCCAHLKKRIEVEYFSFTHSYELRYLVSDILKYSENKLRGAFGVKSRLSVYALPTEMKKCIDEYFETIVFSPRNKGEIVSATKKSKPVEEYEKFYTPAKTELDTERAFMIENDSWNVTQMLVGEELAEETITDKAINIVSQETQIEQNITTDARAAFGKYYNFILAVLNSDVGAQRRILSEMGIMADALVDEINEISADVFGDIIIEDNGDGYVIIEEYKDLIEP